MSQSDIDAKNSEFWNELCGTGLALEIGISDASAESLQRFDDAYLRLYPYLLSYVTGEDLLGKKVLEIGLGYGTLGTQLMGRGAEYYGLDLAPNAVEMMRYRMLLAGEDDSSRVEIGSALEIPHEDDLFDYVYSIGCLHHTGNLERAISEVHRVLGPGGRAVVMLYNRRSFRQFSFRVLRLGFKALGMDTQRLDARIGSAYDRNREGDAAPHTDYVSKREIRESLFSEFRSVRIDVQNFDSYLLARGPIGVHRAWLLNNVARIVGTDLYIVATK